MPCSATVVPGVPPRETNVAFGVPPALMPAAATSANAWVMLVAALPATPAGSPWLPASTKSLVHRARPYCSKEYPPATNSFSSEAAWTIRTLAPAAPDSACAIALPEPVPMYLKVNCG